MSRFTPDFKDVFTGAQRESRLLRQNYLSSEHLLLGLLQKSQSGPAQLLLAQGVDLVRVRQVVEQLPGHGEVSGVFTRELRQLVHLAADEAQKRKQSIMPEHLFLALNLLPASQAMQILHHLGLNLDDLRAQALQSLPPESQTILEFMGTSTHPSRENTFTPRARHLLYRGEEEAWLYEQTIDREHLLLGLPFAGQGVALRVLQSLDVDLDVAEQRFMEILSQRDRGPLVLAQDSKRSIELAVKEAFQFKHHYLGTEHLLLGMLNVSEERHGGIFAGLGASRDHGDHTGHVFASLGLTLKRVRKQTLAVLASGASDNNPD